MFQALFRTFVFSILLALVLFGLPSYSMSQGVEAWSNLGLYGGQMYDIAIDPTNPDKMFAGSYMGDGLFVTEDGGSSWRAVETENEPEGEGTFKNHAVWAVKIAPSDNNVIWVAHNQWVEKSTDGGQTWTHIRNSTMQRDCPNCGGQGDNWRFCRSLAIDPTNPDIVYVGTGGPSETYPSGAIYKTDNGGTTWTKMNQGANFDHSVVDIDVDQQDRDIVWAVTNSFGYGGWAGTLYRSEDGGQTWIVVFTIAGSFYDVEVKPNGSNTVFTGNAWGIFKHYYDDDTGEWKYEWILNYWGQWPPPSDIVFARQVQSLAFDPQNPNVIYATWKNPWGGDPLPKVARGTPPYGDADWKIYTVDHEFLTLTVHPTNSEVVFGGELSLGVYKSQDHGQTWTPINNGINAVIVKDVDIDPKDSSHILAATIAGLYEKKGAKDWSLISDFPYSSAYSVQFHPTNSQTFYVGIEGQLAKTIDAGESWTFSNWLNASGNAYNSVQDIGIDPINTDTVFIAVNGFGNYGEIYKSTDGGDTFNQVLEGVNQSDEKYPFNAVAIDPSDPQHIFAGGGSFHAPKVFGDLWESKDGGVKWDRNPLSFKDVIVNALLIDPNSHDTMYAGCGYSGGTDVPVYKSTDGGGSWSASYEGIPGLVTILMGVWGSSATNVFVVGKYGTAFAPIFHYNGSAWAEIDSGTTEDLINLWGSSGTNVFAVGTSGTILRYDGNTWSAMNSGTTENLSGVWGSSGMDVFAVGDNGIILRYDGNWSPMVSGTTEALESVWGSSPTDVFAMGDDGTILHYDGNTWSTMSSGTTKELYGVWGSSGANVFAVGDGGTVLHYDGSTWSAMSSGTTKELYGVWGSSGANVFAVGDDGTVLHYDGSTWTEMSCGTTEYLSGIWGSSGRDVFAVGGKGGIFHYNGSAWSVMRQGGRNWNAVTDLEFHRENTNVVYASTNAAGVYISPNLAGNWLNLGKPEYDVYAIATSSLYAATQGGLLQCTGTGVIAGQIYNAISQTGINNATVSNDFGAITISINGEYMMVSPSGICDVTSTAESYIDTTTGNITVYGGDVSWANIEMPPDSVVIDVIPHQNAGITDSSRVPNNTSFAVRIEDPDGIDITNPASVRFTVNDGATEYTRDLNDPTVRYKKLVSGEDDTQVTKLWVVYDRSKEADLGNYAYEATVDIRIDVEGTTQVIRTFKVETEAEHNDAQNNLPNVTNVDPADPALDPQEGYDEGVQVTDGDLQGAKIVYNSNEPVTPTFGPANELPSLDTNGAEGVGVPMNLQPTGALFDTPVKIFIPCPGYIDVSGLPVYYYNGVNWVLACDANGNVQPGGEGWMVPGSRVNHNGGAPPTIEMRIYHFSGVQAGTSAPPPAPSTGPSAGTGGGGGGCFISTAAHGCYTARLIGTLHTFVGLCFLIGCVWYFWKFKLRV